ncbi:DUF3055 domain-containing protein [Paenibacillus sp. F411]|uniref:Cytosolic protein n=1 Tax=Paenibacillus algicola TaxID=2565926 RepID=A0A4P8XQ92_9BACL|nr:MULTISPECIES: DUF3055 domain-containing protein [Paenibacillus]MBO2943517.1 DUF3055 domain-containing protein [Paenibacillus sp. F411]QCT03881.1 hypothetical protein E6C60_3170 [Paenibacillus algicola]
MDQDKEQLDYLSDSTESTSTRFVTFIGPSLKRFDLAVTSTDRFYGKKLVTDLQFGRSAILADDDLEEEGLLERTFRLEREEADDMRSFLSLVLGSPHFTD